MIYIENDDLELRIREEKVSAWSVNADFEKRVKPKVKLNYGAEYISNRIGSTGNILDLSNGTTSPTFTRYPDGSTWSSVGAYSSIIKKWNTRYKTEAGLRYNYVAIDGTLDTSFINFPVTSIKGNNQAVTGSISHLLRLKTGSIGIVTSTAFRSPNIDDVSKVFDRNSGFVVVPNASLKPEYAYNAELNGDYIFKEKLKTSVNHLDQVAI